MPLPCEPLDHILDLDDDGLFMYFCEYARFFADAPTHAQYQIRVRTRCLRSSDTHDLRLAFDRWIANQRRLRTRRKNWKQRIQKRRRYDGI